MAEEKKEKELDKTVVVLDSPESASKEEKGANVEEDLDQVKEALNEESETAQVKSDKKNDELSEVSEKAGSESEKEGKDKDDLDVETSENEFSGNEPGKNNEEETTQAEKSQREEDENPIIEELIIPGEEKKASEEEETTGGEDTDLPEIEEIKEQIIEDEPKEPEKETEDDIAPKASEDIVDGVSGEDGEEKKDSIEQEESDEAEDFRGEKKPVAPRLRKIVYASGAIVLIILLIGSFIFFKYGRGKPSETEMNNNDTQKISRTEKTTSKGKASVLAEHTESFIIFYNESTKPLLIKVKLKLELPKGKEKSKAYLLFKDYLYQSVLGLKFYREKKSKWDLYLLKEIHKIITKWPGEMPVHLTEVTNVEIL